MGYSWTFLEQVELKICVGREVLEDKGLAHQKLMLSDKLKVHGLGLKPIQYTVIN